MIDRETQQAIFKVATTRDARGDIEICKPPMTWFEDGDDYEAALTKSGEDVLITRVTTTGEVTKIVLPRTVLKALVKQAGGHLP